MKERKYGSVAKGISFFTHIEYVMSTRHVNN